MKFILHADIWQHLILLSVVYLTLNIRILLFMVLHMIILSESDVGLQPTHELHAQVNVASTDVYLVIQICNLRCHIVSQGFNSSKYRRFY